ncbi:MAG: RHS repeat-associated core domain-containing protein, partial [Bacteroidota bacterium]
MKKFFILIALLLIFFQGRTQDVVPDAIELEVLKNLYDSTNGDGWTSNTNWPSLANWPSTASSADYATWHGITVQNGDITKISLTANMLDGNLPSTLGQLTALKELLLDGNLLQGEIPTCFGDLTNLTSLDLSSNILDGEIPESLGNLGSLIYLYLDNNLLSGSIPDELGNLSSLKYLYLYLNDLSGNIPGELGQLTNLWDLRLQLNSLSGSISPELGGMSQLRTLRLNANQLSGSIPAALGQISTLNHLHLTSNNLEGAIPEEIGNLSLLTYLYLDYNNLSGAIPESFGNLTKLAFLMIRHNQLEGAMPDTLASITTLNWIYAHDNKFTRIPDFSIHPKLSRFHMARNRLDFGSIEENLTGPNTYHFSGFFSYLSQRAVTDLVQKQVYQMGDVLVADDRTGGQHTAYQWQKWDGTAWQNIAGATDSTYDFSATRADAGRYRCEMTNTWVPGEVLYTDEIKLVPEDEFNPVPNHDVFPAVQGRSDGSITAIKWRTYGSHEQAFTYRYDALGRLQDAYYASKDETTGGWTRYRGNYNVEALNYDANGNIASLDRYANREGGQKVDEIAYTYDGNQLQEVTDNAPFLEGFEDGNVAGTDYTYDDDGNIIADLNRGITLIEYNRLNLPRKITMEDGSYIIYKYDATGALLIREHYDQDGTRELKRQFKGEFEYEDDVLKVIYHDFGRIVSRPESGPSFGDLEYQYHIADHQGNTRVTFTTAPQTQSATATLETAQEDTERVDFIYYDDVIKVNSPLFDHTGGTDTQYALRLSGTTNEQIGLAKSLQVMPGDVIKTEVYAKYVDPNNANWTTQLADFLATIANGTAPAGTVIDGASAGATASFPFLGTFTPDPGTGTGPQAYLNVLVFDEHFNFLYADVDRIDESAVETGTDVPHDKLMVETTIEQAGYVYIYLSNDNATPVEVYFDDFAVTHEQSPLIQSSDFYPFGLAFNSHVRENIFKNRFLYNGSSELNEKTGLYETPFRQYDPAIGRLNGIDPVAGKYSSLSPYNFAFNDPINFSDPSGADPMNIPLPSGMSSGNGGGINNSLRISNRGFGTFGANGSGSFGWSPFGPVESPITSWYMGTGYNAYGMLRSVGPTFEQWQDYRQLRELAGDALKGNWITGFEIWWPKLLDVTGYNFSTNKNYRVYDFDIIPVTGLGSELDFFGGAIIGGLNGVKSSVEGIQSLGTAQGWIDMANGFGDQAAMMNPLSSSRGMMLNAQLAANAQQFIQNAPNMSAGEWGYLTGFAGYKVFEGIVISKGTGFVVSYGSGFFSASGLFRRTANVGAFSHLQVPMQMRYVKHYAGQGGIGLDGVRIKILRQSDLVNYPATGSASGKTI